MLKLYYAPGTIATASVMCLRETGIDHELVEVDFTQSVQMSPEYHRINPKGRVPALDLGGEILTETGAILEYLAELVPDQGLVPGDPLKAGRMREVMFYLASTMHVNHAHKRRGHRWADKEDSLADMSAKVPQTMTDSARYMEENIIVGPYLFGDVVTVADFYFYAICNWLEGDRVDVRQFPKIGAFRQAMRERASVAATHDDNIL
ncbi:glutathione S-transferase family protein [Roseovarius sp. C7]|uniref:glutathione S-transferase family protein n=1 Tax=Roseovarius sp. C7 TaxID=3398643 RepID=UPI0039F678F5